MDAKETVMPRNYLVMIGLEGKPLEEQLEIQAEISFKAGIREVLKGLIMIDKESYDTRDFTRRVCDLIVEWQSQLEAPDMGRIL